MRFANLAAIAVLLLALQGTAVAQEPPATITVTGEGRVEAAPDMATISLGVTTEAETASAAMTENSDAVAAVLTRLAETGIDDRDIQTSGLSLGPRYNYRSSDGEAPEITGYTVSNMVTVRLRALDTLGGILDRVVSDGANTLNGLAFGLQDDRDAMDEARRGAVAEAARKAALYADAAGVTLGPILSIHEGGAMMPQPKMMAEASFARDGGVPVAGGELSIGADVTIVYAIAQ
ncbi:26 kDa periplasmic immunogenic protein [Defluviimonas aquaemixtae]|uniref:26 kDa periplasmic immunogenic protein n=1 Tax=Albidovulum aquaemixtae TaxID=1542388 RepID=A0A2R8BNA2_9RHOB|nr:SIMPL domain-containing protein [Defluviimonas aquaemixtae]SPH24927.1 26 kDa periplasmic immunogenic protein [Defluviimonas aquaemixtae]